MTATDATGIGMLKIVTTSAAKQIAESLRVAIFEGRIKVDTRLPTEDELAAHFNVSRPTIREALKRLAAENLIHSRRGPSGGNFVRKIKFDDVRDQLANSTRMLIGLGNVDLNMIADFRTEVETLAVRLACANRTDENLARLRDEIALQRDTKISDVDFCASDVRFHVELAHATGNPLFAMIVAGAIEGVQPTTNLVVFRFRDRQIILGQHESILAALEVRDEPEAERVLSDQMTYLRGKYAEAEAWRERQDAGKARA